MDFRDEEKTATNESITALQMESVDSGIELNAAQEQYRQVTSACMEQNVSFSNLSKDAEWNAIQASFQRTRQASAEQFDQMFRSQGTWETWPDSKTEWFYQKQTGEKIYYDFLDFATRSPYVVPFPKSEKLNEMEQKETDLLEKKDSDEKRMESLKAFSGIMPRLKTFLSIVLAVILTYHAVCNIVVLGTIKLGLPIFGDFFTEWSWMSDTSVGMFGLMAFLNVLIKFGGRFASAFKIFLTKDSAVFWTVVVFVAAALILLLIIWYLVIAIKKHRKTVKLYREYKNAKKDFKESSTEYKNFKKDPEYLEEKKNCRMAFVEMQRFTETWYIDWYVNAKAKVPEDKKESLLKEMEARFKKYIKNGEDYSSLK